MNTFTKTLFLLLVSTSLAAPLPAATIIDGNPGVTVNSAGTTFQPGGLATSVTDVTYAGYDNLWFYVTEMLISTDGNAFDADFQENLAFLSIVGNTATWTGQATIPAGSSLSGAAVTLDTRFRLVASGGYDTITQNPAPLPGSTSVTVLQPTLAGPFPVGHNDTADDVFVHATGDFSVTLFSEARVQGSGNAFTATGPLFDSLTNSSGNNDLRHDRWSGLAFTVPEPNAALLLLTSVCGLGLVRRR